MRKMPESVRCPICGTTMDQLHTHIGDELIVWIDEWVRENQVTISKGVDESVTLTIKEYREAVKWLSAHGIELEEVK
jgi:hypothetical protein